MNIMLHNAKSFCLYACDILWQRVVGWLSSLFVTCFKKLCTKIEDMMAMGDLKQGVTLTLILLEQ